MKRITRLLPRHLRRWLPFPVLVTLVGGIGLISIMTLSRIALNAPLQQRDTYSALSASPASSPATQTFSLFAPKKKTPQDIDLDALHILKNVYENDRHHNAAISPPALERESAEIRDAAAATATGTSPAPSPTATPVMEWSLEWQYRFDANLTHHRDFRRGNDTVQSIPFLKTTLSDATWWSSDAYTLVVLPLGAQGNLLWVGVLPKSSIDQAWSVFDRLDWSSFSQRFIHKELSLLVPRVNVQTTLNRDHWTQLHRIQWDERGASESDWSLIVSPTPEPSAVASIDPAATPVVTPNPTPTPSPTPASAARDRAVMLFDKPFLFGVYNTTLKRFELFGVIAELQ
jgi:hypothetical protein